jgi:hypothetical protein
MKSLRICLTIIVALGFSGSVFAGLPGESIVQDAHTGNYTITYCGLGPVGAKDTCVLRQVVFVPSTKINPYVRASLKFDKQWNIQYRYLVTNEPNSSQPLISFILDPVSNIVSQIPLSTQWGKRTEAQMQAEVEAGRRALFTPALWEGDVTPSDKSGLRIVWLYKNTEAAASGLRPAQTQPGFGYSSQDIAGIGIANLAGNSGADLGFVDEGPSGDIAQQLNQLQANDFVARYVPIPAINVGSPFNAATTLRSIQKQTQTWVSIQQLDSSLSAQFDRLFESAINAAGRNDSNGMNTYLAEIRKAIRNEHPDLDRDEDKDDHAKRGQKLISKLAAQVLDFDLKYIKKRMGGGDD